jgi:hypothetical protein
MFTDYIENIQYLSAERKSLDRFLKKNVVINLPTLFPQHLVDYSIDPSKVIKLFTQCLSEVSPSEYLLFSTFNSENDVYTLYKIKSEHALDAITAFIDEYVQKAKQEDKIIRTQLAASFEKLFDGLSVCSVFKEKFMTDLKTKSVSRDFLVDGSLAPERLIKKSNVYFVKVNIRFSVEHDLFLRKVLNIKNSVELMYRGYVIFSSDFTINTFQLKLFSADDLYREHFEYTRRSEIYCFISSKQKPKPYALDQKERLFFNAFGIEDYKLTLYALLKFQNHAETLAKYSAMFPELYQPSAYDFANLSLEDWDTRFLIQDMIDI